MIRKYQLYYKVFLDQCILSSWIKYLCYFVFNSIVSIVLANFEGARLFTGLSQMASMAMF